MNRIHNNQIQKTSILNNEIQMNQIHSNEIFYIKIHNMNPFALGKDKPSIQFVNQIANKHGFRMTKTPASICKNSFNTIKNDVLLKRECPDAESGRSKRKSGEPDFFRLPCGARPFSTYPRYVLPHTNTFKGCF